MYTCIYIYIYICCSRGGSVSDVAFARRGSKCYKSNDTLLDTNQIYKTNQIVDTNQIYEGI